MAEYMPPRKLSWEEVQGIVVRNSITVSQIETGMNETGSWWGDIIGDLFGTPMSRATGLRVEESGRAYILRIDSEGQIVGVEIDPQLNVGTNAVYIGAVADAFKESVFDIGKIALWGAFIVLGVIWLSDRKK